MDIITDFGSVVGGSSPSGCTYKKDRHLAVFFDTIVHMELSERYIAKLESEGFKYIYEWQDEPGKVYEEHEHKGKVSLYVTDGSITFDFSGETKEVMANQRLDIPAGKKHAAVVGPQGAIYIVAEEVEGDS